MPDLVIRPMTRPEIDLALDWAAAEGWNPGLDDAAAFYTTDPEGFLIGLLGTEPIGCISAVRYPDDFAFLGFYIVRPKHRGRGYGRRLWEAGMRRLEGCNVGLDGVTAQQGNYQKSGFSLAHRNIRYGGHVHVPPPDELALAPITADLLPRLIRYDRLLFPAPRGTFLQAWLDPASTRRGFTYFEGSVIRGYGVVRPCRDGYKIGPLFADRPEVAEALFQSLAATAGGIKPLFLDTPEPNGMAVALAESHGLKPVFETARMYSKADPKLPLERIYGITTFELG